MAREIFRNVMRGLRDGGYARYIHGSTEYEFSAEVYGIDVYQNGEYLTEFTHRAELMDFIDEIID